MLEELEWSRPEEIEKRSMEIIEQEMPDGTWNMYERDIVKRCIHTTADFDYAKNLCFSADGAERGIAALKRGVCIVTDTSMAAAGINKAAIARCGSEVRCFMAEPDVAREAKERGVTRAVVCMERGAALDKPVIFAIGNAPTALVRLHELMGEGLRPELIIGAPVGFVNVVESKELICRGNAPYIVAKGRKGGSTVAAAICNALLYRAAGR